MTSRYTEVEKKIEILFCIPCYNEEKRLDTNYLSQVAQIPGVKVLLVDDGSVDATSRVLLAFKSASAPGRVETLLLANNVGKGEAVRQGFLWARANVPESEWIGFIDADGAISLEDIRCLVTTCQERSEFDMIWSSRVALAGRKIERSLSRHYLARAFSTLIGIFEPDLPYDTQSGLKAFSANETLDTILQRPFRTRWLFEIEMLIRWKSAVGLKPKVWEFPVISWRDVAGSKVASWTEVYRMVFEVIRVMRLARRSKSGDGEGLKWT